jgi:hypothetical protein
MPKQENRKINYEVNNHNPGLQHSLKCPSTDIKSKRNSCYENSEIMQFRGTIPTSADHSGSLECWDRGFESHSSHGCLSTFILFVLYCVGRGIASG